jgi:hypothetical protein
MGGNLALLVGATLAVSVGLLALGSGLDRDRAFYPTVMIVIALYYVLFAVIGGSTQDLLVEVLVASVFIAAALWGFKSSLWIVVVALFAHGVLDLIHGRVIPNQGVPAWWPQFCMTYDIAAAAFLAWLLRRRRFRSGA